MKKFLKKIIAVVCVVLFIGIAPSGSSQANAASKNKYDIQVVRVVENGVRYIVVLLDGIAIFKTIEL